MEIIYRLIAHTDPAISQIEQLYTSAFPADERRDFCDFLSLLADEESVFAVMGALDAGDESRLLAFITFWDFGTIMYLEHFAVIPQMRGHGIGTTVFTHFLGNIASTIVLEVEPPETQVAIKRIKFYEALGLKLWPQFHYVQPPYSPDKNELELKLMTHGNVTLPMLENAVEEIYDNVYGRRPARSAE